MVLQKYKAVFFDVGGTLIEVYPSVGEVYTRYARSFGFTGDSQVGVNQFAIEWKRTGGLSALGNKSTEKLEKKFWRDLVFRVFQPLGGLHDFEEYFNLIYEVFKKAENWRVYEDVLESGLLQILKNQGIVLGVVSNWDSRLFEILKNVKLAHHFDFILPSTIVGSAKPDEKIFLEALRKSGTTVEKTCHIGDDLHSDFFGARNLGMDSILIDRKDKIRDKASPKVSSFLELV